ncbi:Uncharacterised protein [uncultured archaeon]|nr:Uncharacterised protein [uncultured archaeon]
MGKHLSIDHVMGVAPDETTVVKNDALKFMEPVMEERVRTG